MPIQLPDGTTVNDDGSPIAPFMGTPGAAAPSSTPLPPNWQSRLGGLPSDVAQQLINDPNVRALMIAQPNTTVAQAGAAVGTIPQGYKNDGGTIAPDNSVRNGALIGGAILGGGALAAGLAGGGAAAGAGAAGAADATGGVTDLGAVSPSEFGGAASTVGPMASDVGNVAGPGVSGITSSSSVPDWLSSASQIGKILGNAGTGATAGLNASNTANASYANAQNNLYNSQLTGYNDALAAPGKIAGNAVRGDILSNARDVSLAAPSDIPVPTINGGLRPSMFSPTTQALGKSITANAAGTPLPTATMPTPPTLQPFQTPGVGTNLLNTAGLVSSLAGPVASLATKIPWGSIFG